jgi:hypothetical protein
LLPARGYSQKTTKETPEAPLGVSKKCPDDTGELGGISIIEFIVSSEVGSKSAKRF